jgi:hypothetical protein
MLGFVPVNLGHTGAPEVNFKNAGVYYYSRQGKGENP